MALKFKCPKCGQELTVKDELAGRQGKCPACKATVTVPSLAGSKPRPASAPAPAPAGRKPASRDDDVVDAEVVEEVEEVVDAEVVEDDRPARKSGVKRDTSADDFDMGPADKGSKSRRRDEDDEDDRPRRRGRDDDDDDRPRRRGRDEDEDDRPRRRRRDDDEDDDDRRRRPAARGRRDDYDDDDDLDDDDRDRKKKLRKAAWRKASTGGLLNFIGAILIASFMGLTFLSLVLGLILGAAGAGAGGLGIIGVISYLNLGLLVSSHVLGIVGCVFCIFAPGKHGEMGLAITALVLNGLCALIFLFLLIDGAALGLLARVGGRGGIIIIFWPLLELARLTLYAIFMWAACKSAKDHDTASSALTVGIVVPSAIFGMALIVVLFGSLVSSVEMAVVVMIITILCVGAAAGILGWYAMVAGAVRNTMRWAK